MAQILKLHLKLAYTTYNYGTNTRAKQDKSNRNTKTQLMHAKTRVQLHKSVFHMKQSFIVILEEENFKFAFELTNIGRVPDFRWKRVP